MVVCYLVGNASGILLGVSPVGSGSGYSVFLHIGG